VIRFYAVIALMFAVVTIAVLIAGERRDAARWRELNAENPVVMAAHRAAATRPTTLPSADQPGE
jgi:uncharacterized membrane-anchored protein